MEQRKSYQLYLLEWELQKAEFEYESAYRSQEKVQKRIDDYKFYLRMNILYAIMTVIFMASVDIISFFTGGTDLVILIIPFALLMSLVSIILWAGMSFKYIKYMLSYKELKNKKQQTEWDLFSASQKLNGIQLKIEKLQEENTSWGKDKQKEKTEQSKAQKREELVCRQEALGYRIDRLKKDYDDTEQELHRLLKEEFENDREKKRYRNLTITGIIVLMIFIAIQGLDIAIFSTVASRVIILLMPWCIIIPYSIGWLSKSMNTFWGEELWINRFIFREMHDYSIAGKIRKCQENMKGLKEHIGALEKEQTEIIKKM